MKFERGQWREDRSYGSGTVVCSKIEIDGQERSLQMFIEDEKIERLGERALENGYYFVEETLKTALAKFEHHVKE